VTVTVSFLGGLGEVGRNCAALEIDGRIALIDCGLMFPEEEMLGVDLVLPDFSSLRERRDDVACVVLTHGHEDHQGALAYFLREFDVPVYGTELTLAIARSRVDDAGIDAEYRPVHPGTWIEHGPFRFMHINVAHSVPQSTGVAFDTPEGLIVHSGDFKLDSTPVDGVSTDLPAFGELGRQGVRLLLADSTNAEEPGFEPSESSLAPILNDLIAEAPGRVILAAFSSHLHRVQQLVAAADHAGRKVAFLGRSMERNTRIGVELGVLRLPSGGIMPIDELLELPDDEVAIVTTGSQGEPFAALSLMAAGQHRAVDIRDGDTVVISATPIPGNETKVSRVISNLMRRGARVVHGRNAHVHVSGHAAQEELRTFHNVIRPETFVPVHGEYRHLASHARLAETMEQSEVVLCENGDRLVLESGQLQIERDAVPASYVYLDGYGIGDVERGVLRDRKRLADDGVIVVTVGVDKETGEIVFGPEIDSHGITDEPAEIHDDAVAAVTAALAGLEAGSIDYETARQAVRRAAAGVVRKATARRPVVLPVVVEI
jgi:ribonuclease J